MKAGCLKIPLPLLFSFSPLETVDHYCFEYLLQKYTREKKAEAHTTSVVEGDQSANSSQLLKFQKLLPMKRVGRHYMKQSNLTRNKFFYKFFLFLQMF